MRILESNKSRYCSEFRVLQDPQLCFTLYTTIRYVWFFDVLNRLNTITFRPFMYRVLMEGTYQDGISIRFLFTCVVNLLSVFRRRHTRLPVPPDSITLRPNQT